MQSSQSQLLPPTRRAVGSARSRPARTVPSFLSPSSPLLSYSRSSHSPSSSTGGWCLGEGAELGSAGRGFDEMEQDWARRSVAMLAMCCSALLLVAAPAYLASAAPVEDGLLSNGDFETAPTGGFAKSASVAEGASSIPDWTINGTVELISAGQHQGGMILIVPQGDHAVRLGNDASVGQVVQVEKGSEYGITFSAARTCAQLEALNVSVLGGVSQTVDLQTLYNIEGWDAYALAFQATDEEAHIQFMNPGMEDDPTCGPILDNVAVKKLFTPDKPKDNVVVNGDFEEGPWMFPNTSFGVLLPTNLDEQTSALPGWMIESNRAVRYVDSDEYKVPQGKRAIELLSGKEGIISQMVDTTPQKVYSLAFTLGSAGDSCQPPMAVMAFAGDQAQNFHYSPMGNATSQAANVTFTARAERTRVAFYSIYYNTRSDDHSSLCGPVIDDVRVWGLNAAAGLKASVGLVLGIVAVVCMVLF